MDNSTLSSVIVLILELRDLERRLAEASYGWKTSKVKTLHSAANMLQQLSDRVNSLETENAALKEELHAAMAYVPRSCATCKRDDNTDCRNNGGCNWEWNKACSPEAARSLIEENQRLKEKCAALLHDLGSTPSACDFCTGEDCKRSVMDSGGCHFVWRGPRSK